MCASVSKWHRVGGYKSTRLRGKAEEGRYQQLTNKYISYSPPARWGLLDFMSVACSSSPLISSPPPPLLLLLLNRDPRPQWSLSDLNHDHPSQLRSGREHWAGIPAVEVRQGTLGVDGRGEVRQGTLGMDTRGVPCRTSTTTIHAQCSLPDLNREYPCQVFPAGPHVGRYGTKNAQKKVRKNVRQICYILFANSRVCGRVPGAMPLLTLQTNDWDS